MCSSIPFTGAAGKTELTRDKHTRPFNITRYLPVRSQLTLAVPEQIPI